MYIYITTWADANRDVTRLVELLSAMSDAKVHPLTEGYMHLHRLNYM